MSKKTTVFLFMLLICAACTTTPISQVVLEATITEEANIIHTPTPFDNTTATSVAIATGQANKTSTAEAASTQLAVKGTESASSMFAFVQSLYEESRISTTNGKYRRLIEVRQSWAKINWFNWQWPRRSEKNFILRADTVWESANDKANWFNSGCGFFFRASSDGQNFYVAYLGLDGYVYMLRYVKGVWTEFGKSYYGLVDTPNGNAELALVVEENNFHFLVNNEVVHSRSDSKLTEGDYGYTVHSGTNTTFGTRCIMTNIDLWVIDN